MPSSGLNIGEFVSKPRVTQYLGVLWALHIWGSIWYLAPGSDDGAFISQALGFLNFGDLGILYVDRFQRFYINLPGYSFTQSVFYLIWDSVGLPINFFTYKIFHLLVVSVLIATSVTLLKRTSGDNSQLGFLRANVFLILLPVTPFVIDVLSPRPEAFGLATLAGGMLCAQAADAKSKSLDTVYYASAAFLFGSAMTTHPMFVVVGGGCCLAFAWWLLQQKRYSTLAISIACALIPISAMAAWFAWHAPESIRIMQAHVGTHSANLVEGFGTGILVMLGYATLLKAGHFPYLAQLYYAVCYGVLTLVTVGVIVLQIKKYVIDRKKIEINSLITISIFGMPFIYLIFSYYPKVQVFTMVSYCFVFSFVAMLSWPSWMRSKSL